VEIVLSFLFGIGIFAATGIDDFVVVCNLLNKKEQKKARAKVLVGTLIGLAIMFSVCLVIVSVIDHVATRNEWFRLSGIPLLVIGTLYIHKNLKKLLADEDEETIDDSKGLIAASAIIYVTNMTDDVAVNSSYLFSMIAKEGVKGGPVFFQAMALFAGNVVACVGMIFLAQWLMSKVEKPRTRMKFGILAGAIIYVLAIKIFFL
jgi:cadmium resistance protein CadD (predicted permease)